MVFGLSSVAFAFVPGADLHPAAERVDDGGEDPAGGVVVLRHLRVAGLTGLLRDRLRVGAELTPRRRRLVRVETGFLEERAVVVECLRVRTLRQGDDLPLGVGSLGEHRRVVLREVRELLHVRRQVGELTVVAERARVRERHLEDGGQRAARELRRERRCRPLVVDRLDVDGRIRLLELGDPCVELVDCCLRAAWNQRSDADGDRAPRRAEGCGCRARRHQAGDGGGRCDPP